MKNSLFVRKFLFFTMKKLVKSLSKKVAGIENLDISISMESSFYGIFNLSFFPNN